MTKRFHGRTALVTGAASGIGAATARMLALEGAAVFCADRNQQGTEAVVHEIRERLGSAETALLDVTDEAGWIALFARIRDSHGRLDILVNSAGISMAAATSDMEYSSWRQVLAVNLDGVFLGTKHAIRAMRDGGGSIVNVSSASGLKAAPGAAAYSASKAAVCMFGKAVAKECAGSGIPIRVNTVCPAGVKTPMWSSMPFFKDLVASLGSEDAAYLSLSGSAPGSRFSEPEEIARAILFLASDEAAQITGLDLVIDGGYTL